jgi:hypothetical protein
MHHHHHHSRFHRIVKRKNPPPCCASSSSPFPPYRETPPPSPSAQFLSFVLGRKLTSALPPVVCVLAYRLNAGKGDPFYMWDVDRYRITEQTHDLIEACIARLLPLGLLRCLLVSTCSRAHLILLRCLLVSTCSRAHVLTCSRAHLILLVHSRVPLALQQLPRRFHAKFLSTES